MISSLGNFGVYGRLVKALVQAECVAGTHLLLVTWSGPARQRHFLLPSGNAAHISSFQAPHMPTPSTFCPCLSRNTDTCRQKARRSIQGRLCMTGTMSYGCKHDAQGMENTNCSACEDWAATQYNTSLSCREYRTLTDQIATKGILQLANKKGMTCTVTHDHSVLHVSRSLSPACIIIYESEIVNLNTNHLICASPEQ